jgi:subtilase family serine protease
MNVLSRSASRRLFVLLISVAAIPCCSSLAQQNNAAQAQLAAQPLITQPINEHQLTLLKGNTHPLARPQFDLGTAPATLPMQRMLLVLKRSANQEFALRKLLDDQQDKHSVNYHKWLTPEQFGKLFGPADGDMQTITAWLQSHGFQVGTTKGRTVLEFSGSASQVQEAFHTAIHRYVVNGEEHWANASDPSIPTALTPAVAGVLTLHNFLKRPQIRMLKQPITGKLRPGKSPELTFSDGTHAMAPADFATIYNSEPLLTNPLNPVYGSGTIGVVGRSDLYGTSSANEDVTEFQSVFGVGVSGGFYVIHNGADPGDLGGDDEAEATLDSTWPGAVAPGASVDLVVSATTNTTDGIDLSEVYIIENNLADIMTESFSNCEPQSTSAESIGYQQLAEQAAAQGITYFVSTGDDGAEGCDDQDTETVATGPISVNVLASTAYNVAVGGTTFNDIADPTKYWSATNTNQESALSYIPENVWNDSCAAGSCASGNTPNIVAGSGGASIYVSRPSWQAGVAGNFDPNNMRDLPDVSLNADTHDGYVLCLDGSCTPNSQGEFYLYVVGGTSAAAPSFAGIMAIVEQMAEGPTRLTLRQGPANYVLYKLAAAGNPTLSKCNGSDTTTLPASTCTFNDVTVGNNAVPGELNYGLSAAQYQAGVGYDMATGLGSVNIANLGANWDSVTLNFTTTTLTITESPTTHGSSVPFTVVVTPSSGTGAPAAGNVSLFASVNNDEGLLNQSVGMFTLGAAGSVASSTNNLPGGSYIVEAYYAGDSTYAPSYSNLEFVDITPEPSTTTLSVLTFNSNGQQLNFSSGPFGSFVYLRADVAGASGHGTPTGNVNFTDTFGTIPGGTSSGLSLALNYGDSLQSGADTATPNGILSFDTGTHSISATYHGDNSFNASSTPPISFTITPGFYAAISTAQSTVSISAPGASGSSAVSVSSSTGFSGTISLGCSGLPAGAACSFSPATIAATGKLTTTSSKIGVTTTAAAAAVLRPPRGLFDHWLSLSGFMLFSIVLVGVPGRRRGIFHLIALLSLLMLVPGCGGGGSKTTTPPPPVVTPTPAGTYNIVVNATSGSTTYQTGFTLVVE